MENLKFKKKSWHFALAKHWNSDMEFYNRYDICSYSKMVLLGFLKMIFVILLGAMSSLLYVGICYLFANNPLTYAFVQSFPILGFFLFFLEIPIALGLAISAIVLGSGLLHMSVEGIQKLTGLVAKKYDSFLPEAYKSWKDEFCRKIDFE